MLKRLLMVQHNPGELWEQVSIHSLVLLNIWKRWWFKCACLLLVLEICLVFLPPWAIWSLCGMKGRDWFLNCLLYHWNTCEWDVCLWRSFRSLFLFWVSAIMLFTATFQFKSILTGIILVVCAFYCTHFIPQMSNQDLVCYCLNQILMKAIYLLSFH